ncbi:MAG: cytochrome c, partial [Acidobacteria bacterium]|nr:cytochrome c [Acidobacteriota bacterium]
MRREISMLALILGVLALALPGSAAAAEDEVPTFTKDIAPIFQAKCQACHRPGYIAPMSLVTYEESRPWARSIKTRVETRQMPPWHIDKSVGIQAFENDRSLTDDEIDTIARWVDGGAPRGNPEDMPPPVEFVDDDVWNFAGLFGGPPDLVIYSEPYTVPAVAQDRWWKPEVPTGLTEDRWIRAIEIRPSSVDGRRITHHALARLQQEEDPDSLGAASDVGPGLLMEWAVGKQGEIMRPNSGKLIKAG